MTDENESRSENESGPMPIPESPPLGLEILFEKPDGPDGGRFVEVERDGVSFRAGTWWRREGTNLHALRLDPDLITGVHIRAIRPDARSVVIVRVTRAEGDTPETYSQRAQGVMRAVSHAVREAVAPPPVPPGHLQEAPPNVGILVTDERVAVQLVPDQAKLLHEIYTRIMSERSGPLLGPGLIERICQVFEPDFTPQPAGTVMDGEPCSTCEGLGTVDETLGGIPFGDPTAPCPDCDGDEDGE